MDSIGILNLIKDSIEPTGLGRLSTPTETPITSSDISFKGFGILSAGDAFNSGWTFSILESSSAKSLKSFCAGVISYEGATIDTSTSGRIILRNGDLISNLATQLEKPTWFPWPELIIYDGIDQAETEAILTNFLYSNSNIASELIDHATGIDTNEKIVEAFFAGTLANGIPVPAGEFIGVAGIGSGTNREFQFYMQTEDGATKGLYLDPATYFIHCESKFDNLASHPLKSDFQRMFGGPIANTIVRYVKSGGGIVGPFTDPTSPAENLSTALAFADPYDSIVIIDKETYSEASEIIVSKPVNITSLLPGNAIGTTIPSLPTLDGSNAHRVILVKEATDIISITNLIITKGKVNAFSEEAEQPYSGGGIMVSHTNTVYISNCYIFSNETETSGGEHGFGGGVHVFHSSIFLFRNKIISNISIDRGAGIGIWGYGWPVIEENVVSMNHAGGNSAGGRPDGGGIGIEIAYPGDLELAGITDVADLRNGWNEAELEASHNNHVFIIRNVIESNIAEDDGGGVYLSVLSQARFIENNIKSNKAAHAGGGIRATLASHLQIESDVISENISNYNSLAFPTDEDAGSGGGGIAVRDSNVILKNVQITMNTANGWAGGGIYLSSSSEGETMGGLVSYDEIIRVVFDATFFSFTIEGSLASISNNNSIQVSGQTDHCKGGGIYILRYMDDDFTSLPLSANLENLTSVVHGNIITPLSSPAVSPNSVEIHFEDMANGKIVDDSNANTYINTEGVFYYYTG